MDNEARYLFACRLGLLAAAAMHWAVAAMMLANHYGSVPSWEYSPRLVIRIAAGVIHAFANS